MKKIVLPALLVVAMSASSFAQIFIGGNMGFNYNSSTTSTTAGATTTEVPGDKSNMFTLSPMIGYQLNEKFAIGAEVSFGTGSNTSYSPVTDPKGVVSYKETVTSLSSWKFMPFARYTVVSVGKFSAMLHGSIGVNGNSKSTPTDKTMGTITATTTSEASTFNFGLGVVPVVSYKLSDKWSVESYLNFASLSFTSGSTTTKSTTTYSGTGTLPAAPAPAESKLSTTDFNFGVNNRLGVSAINIGFVYSL